MWIESYLNNKEIYYINSEVNCYCFHKYYSRKIWNNGLYVLKDDKGKKRSSDLFPYSQSIRDIKIFPVETEEEKTKKEVQLNL